MISKSVVLLSQQEAHTERVLSRLVWSQSVRTTGHMVLSLSSSDIHTEENVLNEWPEFKHLYLEGAKCCQSQI